MAKFIDVSDQEDTLHHINVDHIVWIRQEHQKDTIVLSIVGNGGIPYSVKTQNSYAELKQLIEK